VGRLAAPVRPGVEEFPYTGVHDRGPAECARTRSAADLDLRYVLCVRVADGRMAEVWEIPFDRAGNDRYGAVQAAALGRQVAPAGS
jgi:hypothetical protein